MRMDQIVSGAQLTRLQFIVAGIATVCAGFGKSAAETYWKSTGAPRKGIFSRTRGPSQEEVNTFTLTMLSLMAHEVTMLSAMVEPSDPHTFQDRLMRGVLELIDPHDTDRFIQAANENIDDLHLLMAGKLDEKTAFFRRAGRFFSLDQKPFAVLAVAHWFAEGRRLATETVNAALQ